MNQNLFIFQNNQQLRTKGNLFKVPIKFDWQRNLDNKNTISNFKADRIDIDITNKGNYLNGEYTYDNNINLLTNSFKTNYKIYIKVG